MEAETRGEYVLLEIGRRGRVREPSSTSGRYHMAGRWWTLTDKERERDRKMLHGIRKDTLEIHTLGSEFLFRKSFWFFECT
jgi:hypothetical protein